MNGFNVNTKIDTPRPRKKVKTIKKLLRNPFIRKGIIAICAVIFVLLFLLIVPLKAVRILDTRTSIDTDGNKEVVYYAKDGKIEKTETYTMNELVNVNKYFYNKDGKIEKIENYYFDNLLQTENYIYTKGLLTEKNAKGLDGAVMNKSLNIYTDGVLELTTDYGSDGKPISETKYVYDKNVLTSKIVTTIQNGYTVTTSYTYEKGQVVKESITTSNGANKEVRYTYDRFGNILTKTENNSNYVTYTYGYTDKKVNVFYKG